MLVESFLRRLVVKRGDCEYGISAAALRFQCQRNRFCSCVAARPGDDRDAPVRLIDYHFDHLRLLRLGERGPLPRAPDRDECFHTGLDLPVDKLPQDDFIHRAVLFERRDERRSRPPEEKLSFAHDVSSGVPARVRVRA